MPQTRHNPLGYSSNYKRKTGRVSSRLAKREQKKMTQQTFLIFGLAIVVVIVFIVAVVPGLIRLTGLFLDGDGVTSDFGDTIPPRVPSISSPVTATYSASIKIEGFSEPESEVVLVMNASESNRSEADSDGKFDFVVDLSDEENSLSLYAIDKAGNESNSSRTHKIIFDDTAPTIEIETPSDGQQFELRKNQNITVKGLTEPRSKVFLNDRLIFAKSDGSFSTSLQLSEGDNELKIKVVDQAGNETEQVLNVKFRF
jgi:hypothetical protein